MIPETIPLRQTCGWQDALKNLIHDPETLCSLLNLRPEDLHLASAATDDFPLRVSHEFVSRMRKGDPKDPLLLQVLPRAQELFSTPGYSTDPLDESRYNPAPGLVHKYSNRVLLITSPSCAIHCRYCFRRHFPYEDNTPGRQQWQLALEYIRAHSELNEVIFSGGDPLNANDRQLAWLTQEITAIPHIQRLRIHTRLPVIIPQRIDDQCLAWLCGHRLQTVMVLHINHPQEIDHHVAQALGRLKQSGVTLLNQTVLLKGVNDSSQCLSHLSETLFAHGVMPYYIHLLDKVQGAAHFEITISQARQIYAELLEQLPGFLVPRFVQEIPDRLSKTPLHLLP